MFERTEVDGRQATVAFLDGNFDPVDKRSADLAQIKIIFDDGEEIFVMVHERLQFKDA